MRVFEFRFIVQGHPDICCYITISVYEELLNKQKKKKETKTPSSKFIEKGC
jgi:hypothetical protein